MAFGPAFDSMMDPSRNGMVLTFILPPRHCNLHCPVCVIRQRKEVEDKDGAELEIGDYISFIESVRKKVTVSHIAIQGYEPLLPESWPYTKSILEYANRIGIESSLATNGTFLDQYLSDLSTFSLKKVSVSLDAPSAAQHDFRRGVDGAFNATSRNLEAAAKTSGLMESLWVTSVLYPDNVQVLYNMPEFLKRKKILRWAISPLIQIGNDHDEGGVAFSYEELKAAIVLLSKQASDAKIEFRVDDEFSLFRNEIPIIPFSVYRSIERVDNIIRLGPNGLCSIGREILKTVTKKTLRWVPNQEHPDAFWDRVDSARKRSLEKAA